MVENINLRCKKCNVRYQRPIKFLLYHLELLDRRGIEFMFKRKLDFCEKHRLEKERGMLKNLGKVMEALANN